ncbi:MAG: type II secretion system protein GspG [Planctomycetes bacterium]|nr:type II secretion system protein GspG [Planctomycetota bacterium]
MNPGRIPWGSPYVYEARGDRVIVVSYGPDREAGTEDDLRYESEPIGRSAGKE